MFPIFNEGDPILLTPNSYFLTETGAHQSNHNIRAKKDNVKWFLKDLWKNEDRYRRIGILFVRIEMLGESWLARSPVRRTGCKLSYLRAISSAALRHHK
jgi:hypothetical protein